MAENAFFLQFSAIFMPYFLPHLLWQCEQQPQHLPFFFCFDILIAAVTAHKSRSITTIQSAVFIITLLSDIPHSRKAMPPCTALSQRLLSVSLNQALSLWSPPPQHMGYGFLRPLTQSSTLWKTPPTACSPLSVRLYRQYSSLWALQIGEWPPRLFRASLQKRR